MLQEQEGLARWIVGVVGTLKSHLVLRGFSAECALVEVDGTLLPTSEAVWTMEAIDSPVSTDIIIVEIP